MSDYESPRRVSRSEAAPASGALAVVLAVVAVIAGFLILRSINDKEDSTTSLGNGSDSEVVADGELPANSDSDGTTGTTAPGGSVPAIPATSLPDNVFTGATVVVVNANSTRGSASKATSTLQTASFEMGEATNSADEYGTSGEVEVSEVLYDPANAGAQPVAETLARVLGINVRAVDTNPPTKSGSFDGAGVLLMLGTDLADMTAADVTTTPATGTVAGNTTPANTTAG